MAVEGFVIDPQSISPSSILDDLNDYIEASPDADKWQDYFNSSTGTIVKKLIAGFGAYLSFNNITARRESFIHFALNRSSILGQAEYKGYSAFRGQNCKVKLNVTPSISGIQKKYTDVGIVKDKDLLLAEDTIFNIGIPIDIICIIGNLKEQEIIIPSDKPNIFRFTEDKVSEDIKLFLNNVEVEWSPRYLDMLYEKFTLLSNPFGSVDAFYLNRDIFTLRYDTNDILKLQWIELADIEFTLNQIGFEYGSLNSKEIYSVYNKQEDKRSVQVNAPLYNESQFVIRGREDYLKRFKQVRTSLISVSGEDVSTSVVRLYYLAEDLLLFTQSEKDDIVDDIMIARQFGVQPPLIGDPTPIPLKLVVKAWLIDGATGDTTAEIQEIIYGEDLLDEDRVDKVLDIFIDFKDLEKRIESLDAVKVSRITIGSTDWQISTPYQKGQYINPTTPNERVYKANRLRFYSDTFEPAWPLPPTVGELVVDNGIIWETGYQVGVYPNWQALKDYILNEGVSPTVPNGHTYKCVGFRSFTGAVEPTWPTTVGDTVIDGGIVWICRDKIGAPPAWQPTTSYEMSEVVEAIDPGGSGTVGLMFQAWTRVRKSGGVEPIWSTTVAGIKTQEITQVECVADVADSLDGSYFVIYDRNGSVGVWIDVDDSGTPIPAGAAACNRNIEIKTIVTDDSKNTVATKLGAQLASDPEFSITISNEYVTVMDNYGGSRIDATDGTPPDDTGFTFVVLTQGADLILDGDVEWICQDPEEDPRQIGVGEYFIISDDIELL